MEKTPLYWTFAGSSTTMYQYGFKLKIGEVSLSWFNWMNL